MDQEEKKIIIGGISLVILIVGCLIIYSIIF